MIQPDYNTFRKLVRHGNFVPVYETINADLLTPVATYLKLARGAKYSCLLESVEGGENIARYTFARSRSRRSISFSRAHVHASKATVALKNSTRIPSRCCAAAFLATGRCVWPDFRHCWRSDRVFCVRHGPPDRTDSGDGRDDLKLDDTVMMFYLGLVAFDHVQHRVWIIRNVFTEGPGSLRAKYDAAVREIRRTRRKLERPLPRHASDRSRRACA